MDINSQHHNLLGNQISPKSGDFCIWQWPPFWIFSTPKKKSATHWWIFLQIFMKFDERNPNFF
jgi:hypothetical protein